MTFSLDVPSSKVHALLGLKARVMAMVVSKESKLLALRMKKVSGNKLSRQNADEGHSKSVKLRGFGKFHVIVSSNEKIVVHFKLTTSVRIGEVSDVVELESGERVAGAFKENMAYRRFKVKVGKGEDEVGG